MKVSITTDEGEVLDIVETPDADLLSDPDSAEDFFKQVKEAVIHEVRARKKRLVVAVLKKHAEDPVAAALTEYARDTAADNSVDFRTAVQMLDDENQLVAEDVGCTVEEVKAFVRAEGRE